MSAKPLLVAVALLAFLPSTLSWAVCAPHRFTEPARIKLDGDSVMIVVHATSTHDARFATKRGLDEAVRYAKDKHIPVIYLLDDSPEQFYFMEDCNPDHWVRSEGGEIAFEVPQTQLYIVGGHLEMCLSTTLHDILYQWAKLPPRNRTVTYFMDAIYSNGKAVEPSDPFYGDFVKFMDVVSYGRPGGEHWPKLSLLETMGVIVSEDHELMYLKKILPRWDKTFAENYRVEMQLNDSVRKVLRPAAGWHPPTVFFNFIDSAINLSSPLPRVN